MSTVGARECVSLLCMMFFQRKGMYCMEYFCTHLLIHHVMEYCCYDDEMIFSIFVHAYISYFFRHKFSAVLYFSGGQRGQYIFMMKKIIVNSMMTL